MKKPRLSRNTIEKLYNEGTVKRGKYLYELKQEWNKDLKAYEEILYRWDEDNEYKRWVAGYKGIWGFEE